MKYCNFNVRRDSNRGARHEPLPERGSMKSSSLVMVLVVMGAFASEAASGKGGSRGGGGAGRAHAGSSHSGGGQSRHFSHAGTSRFVTAPVFRPGRFGPTYLYPPIGAYAYPVNPQYVAPIYIETGEPALAPAPAQPQAYWYYCAESQTYYPYVEQCAGAWQPVVPRLSVPRAAGPSDVPVNPWAGSDAP